MDVTPPYGTYDADKNTVILCGEWDLASKNALRELTDRLRPSQGAAIDLAGAQFIDSSTINEFFHAARRLADDGCRLRLIVGDERIARLLRITKADRLIDIEYAGPSAIR